MAEAVATATGGQSEVQVDTMTTPAADERLAYRGVFQRILVRPEIGAIIGAAAIWVFFWAVATEFGKAGGTSSVLDVAATLGIMAVAVSLLMIGGEFDLSSGAATGTLGIITILIVKDVGELGGAGLSLFIAIPASLVVALGLGWFNGTMVERTALPSFIVTLATFFILRGFKLGFSKLIIDNITVGRIDEGHGYDFWRPIFDYTWARNDHQLGVRDLIFSIAVFGGLALIMLGIYELNFFRRQRANPGGIPIFVIGVGGAIAGVVLMHTTDGVGANAIAGVVIGVSILAALVGLAIWRYERQSPGALNLTPEIAARVGGGVLLVALGAVAAGVIDVDSQESVLDLFGIFRWPFVLVVAVGAGVALFQQLSVDRRRGSALPRSLAGVCAGALAAGFGAYAFMFMTTEQGLRAMLFGALVIGGMILISIGATRASRVSPMTRSVALFVMALTGTGLAFFIRSQSDTAKFTDVVFTILLVGSLLVTAWAVVSSLFAERRHPHSRADSLGTRLAIVGLGAAVFGVVVKLLFTTDDEIAAGLSPANFRISIAWFIGVTIFATWLLGRTKFGSWIFAVGGNKEAARQIGVPAARTKTQLFMIVSVAAWLVGLLLAFRLNTLQSGTGNGLEFEYIIAAVVGGTLLTGGYGSAFGAAIGAVIMAMSKQGIPASRWNSDWRFAFLGVILLAAVIANKYIRTKAEAGAKR